MRENEAQRDFPFVVLGSRARRVLALGMAGRVVAVFRRSFYVTDAGGALACIGPEPLGAGPLNALARLPADFDWVARGLHVGAPVRAENTTLRVGGGFAFCLASAIPWQPTVIGADWRPGDLARGLRMLAATIASAAKEGLAPFVPALAIGGPWPPPRDPLLRLALRPAKALVGWLDAATENPDHPPALPDAVDGLLGLGPGLTPSGDDCLGGVMIALRGFGLIAAADRLAAAIVPHAATQTGAISRAHLEAAAGGEGAAALHEVLAALARADKPVLTAALDDLAAIGHSSGWDALAGAVAVCAALGRVSSQSRAMRPASSAAVALAAAT